MFEKDLVDFIKSNHREYESVESYLTISFLSENMGDSLELAEFSLKFGQKFRNRYCVDFQEGIDGQIIMEIKDK